MSNHFSDTVLDHAAPDVLGDLLGATFDFAALVLIFAVFAAFLVVALLELGLRSGINRRVFGAWWSQWDMAFPRGFEPAHSHAFGLPYRQFTAALARQMRIATNTKSEMFEQIEEAVPTLQQRLGHVWFRWNYALSVLMALLIGALIYITPNKFDPGAGISRQVAYCGDHPGAAPILSKAAQDACNPSEITIITTYLSSTMFLLLAICFCAALVAPVIIDQMERRLLLR